MRKDMKKELEKYSNSMYFLDTSGKLIKFRLYSLDDYDHVKYNLHHYIKYGEYEKNKAWYEERGIKQKLILMSVQCHEHVHNSGIKQLTDEEFKEHYKISRWELIFNRKKSEY